MDFTSGKHCGSVNHEGHFQFIHPANVPTGVVEGRSSIGQLVRGGSDKSETLLLRVDQENQGRRGRRWYRQLGSETSCSTALSEADGSFSSKGGLLSVVNAVPSYSQPHSAAHNSRGVGDTCDVANVTHLIVLPFTKSTFCELFNKWLPVGKNTI